MGGRGGLMERREGRKEGRPLDDAWLSAGREVDSPEELLAERVGEVECEDICGGGEGGGGGGGRWRRAMLTPKVKMTHSMM